jgi:monoamine oxidase
MTSSAPVLILGAGMAGLAAAHTLVSAGIPTIVLEGRDRLGGRILTDQTWGIPLDLGAAWIHGSDNNPLMKWAKQGGSKPRITPDESMKVFNHRGKVLTVRLLDDGEEVYENLLDDVLEFAEARGKDLSMAEAIMELDPDVFDDPLMVYYLSAYLEFDLGGAIETLSARYWDSDEVFDGDDAILTNGFESLIAALAQNVTVELEQVVQRVEWNVQGVRVYTNKGEWKSDRVICTLPLGVLQQGAVTFTPELPKPMTQAWNTVQMGVVNKVCLEFESLFWDKTVQYFGYFAPEKGQYPYFLNLYPLYKFPGLVTFALGSYASRMERQSDATIVAEVMDNLKTMFGRNIPEPKRVLVTRWGADPFARGSYSYASLGAKPKDFKNMGGSVSDRLFFAGEHTNVDYRGTAHGAYLSGLEAAEAVLALFPSQG